MAGTVFKTIKKKIDKEDNEYFIVCFEFNCNDFEKANKIKEYIEDLNLKEI